MLKSSSALAGIQTIGRVTLSLFPLVWVKTRIMRFMSKLIDVEQHPHLAGKQASLLLHSKKLRFWTGVLLAIPFSLIGLVALASSERTPLTGRWRVILLSPAEEEAISADLRGNKWYDAVRDILTQSAGGQPPVVLSPSDWRWAWVEETLRRLERAILTLHNIEGYREAYEHHLKSRDHHLYPPPPKYPLLPRGRATTLLHEMPKHSDYDHEKHPVHPEEHTHHIAPHTLLGPPYSLLVVKNDESNAFSYGFGPGGAGGIVVYSGFLDEILRDSVPPPTERTSTTSSSWSSMFSGSTPTSPRPRNDHIPPTPEQTNRLATLLAHELAHLVLSHHIETLSKGTILFPSIISIGVDTIRSLLYPLTFVIGPFFSDALDRTLRMGFDDLAKAGEACTNTSLEIEADVISARIMALAGYDPEGSLEFWKARMCASAPKTKDSDKPSAHPIGKDRISAIKAEIASWETERNRTLQKLQIEVAA